MTHKILEQLESDILVQAKKNLSIAEKGNKPLIDPGAIFAYNKMIEKQLERGQAQSQEQTDKINLGKDK